MESDHAKWIERVLRVQVHDGADAAALTDALATWNAETQHMLTGKSAAAHSVSAG
jgi:hypothetical protein